MTTFNVKSTKRYSQRQLLAQSGQVADRTLRRWIRFCEANSLDWLRVCPDGQTTPRHLHPYQCWLLLQVLENREKGSEWLAPALLRNPQWSYAHWVKTHQQHTA